MRNHSRRVIVTLFGALYLGVCGTQAAGVIPTQLPRPDNTPPAKDKPVKVYILSGQSNMVGMGRISGAAPVYGGVYLSADPHVMPCRMPVGGSALLPHGVYLEEKGHAAGAKARVYAGAYDPAVDYATMVPAKETTVALGTVSEILPSVEGPHTVVVQAFIEIPITGNYELNAGLGDNTHAIVTLDGKEVYRKDPGGKVVHEKVRLETGRRYPVTVTYMKPGPAVFWMKLVDLQGHGDLETVVKRDGKFGWLVDTNGDWSVRNDVTLCESYLDKNRFKGGRNTPLTATANGRTIGPELGFGYVMGTLHNEPVLLIKSDIGNRSLAWDCLAPGSERYTVDGTMYAGYRDSKSSWPADAEPPSKGEPGGKGWYAGKQYDDYTQAIHGVLDNFDTLYPQFKDQGYEIAGFVWWQGHKDQNPVHASHYEENLTNLIKSWRKEFKAPDAKWAIATIAFEGWRLGEPGKSVAEAQLAVDGDSGRHPEFKGNVKTIESRGFWREMAESPTGTGYHYNHNAETYMLVGDSLGRAMAEMEGAKVEPGPIPPRKPTEPRTWSSTPTLAEAAEMIYSTAFISPWAHDEAEPTSEQMAAMAPIMKPFVLGMAARYAASAPGTPAYRRHGMSLVPIITGKGPKTQGGSLSSQLDELLTYYHAGGIHDYDWKHFGPDMEKATWQYFSFDPPEKQDAAKGDRNRKITYPEGMDNWYAIDFDPEKAGWKTGAAPFGQKNGKKVALRDHCSSAHCGCDVTPGTLWEKEVLLMRQTFQIPELKDNCRYRLVLGGSSHAFSGEGYAIYVNGKRFAESKGGYYKGKAGPRGGYIYDDFRPDFETGKVTIAVKGFLRYTGYKNRVSPPSGHISLWLESMEIPDVVSEAITAKAAKR